MEDWKKFRAFCYYYLINYIKSPFCEMQHDWFRMLQQEACALAAPRGHAKSSIFSRFYPLYKLLTSKNEDIILVSSSLGIIDDSLQMIRSELENNELLIRDFGSQVNKSGIWRNEYLTLLNGNTIRGLGQGGRIRGKRPSTLIIDDLEDDELVLNEDRRVELEKWFKKACWGTLTPNGQIIVVGTILHPYSLLNKLILFPPSDRWMTKKYVAINEDGSSSWEAEWPKWKLDQVKEERGIDAFEQEYQNNPLPDERRRFLEDNIKYYDSLPGDLTVTVTVDPAISMKSSADYTAIIVVGTDDAGTMYIIEAIRKRMEPSDIIDEVFRVHNKYNPHTIGIETVQFQKMLKFQMQVEFNKRGVYPRIKELKLDVSAKGRKKLFRIESLQPLFEAGKIFLNKNQKDLVTELVSFPCGQHDDLVDALASQLELIRPYKPTSNFAKAYPYGTLGRYIEEKKKRSRRDRGIKWHQ